MEQTSGSYIREMVIIGASKESLDTETYSQEAIDEALRAIKEFGGLNNDNKAKANTTDDGDWGDTQDVEGW